MSDSSEETPLQCGVCPLDRQRRRPATTIVYGTATCDEHYGVLISSAMHANSAVEIYRRRVRGETIGRNW